MPVLYVETRLRRELGLTQKFIRRGTISLIFLPALRRNKKGRGLHFEDFPQINLCTPRSYQSLGPTYICTYINICVSFIIKGKIEVPIFSEQITISNPPQSLRSHSFLSSSTQSNNAYPCTS